jgi:precorrin-3B C17-methyltransferase
MLDYAVISLSDLLVPWEQIRGRLEAVAAVDMVVALYNPRSTKRVTQLEEAVAIISSGDAGVYGMAGLAIEMAHHLAPGLSIEIIPGISAANSAAAALGAPLMLDYAVISLSDLLVPWEQIRGRLEAVAAVDMVVALYNPRSTKRVTQLEEAVAIFLKHRPASTPVGIGTAISSPDQRLVMADLGSLLTQDVNMRSIVIIGNTQSKVIDGHFVTPRGYQL